MDGDCDVYKAELTLGCSIFNAAKRVLHEATSTITVTDSLFETMTVSASREDCKPVTITVPRDSVDSLPTSSLTAIATVQEDSSSLLYNIDAGLTQQQYLENRFRTFTTRVTSPPEAPLMLWKQLL